MDIVNEFGTDCNNNVTIKNMYLHLVLCTGNIQIIDW